MAFVEQLSSNTSAKRHLWLVSLLYPLIPLIGTGLALATGSAAWVWLPVAIVYVIVPILEVILGEDKHDLLGLIGDEMEQSTFYRFMLHGTLPLIYAAWLIGAWASVSQGWGWAAILGLTVSHGWGLAIAINSGHETGHKTDKISKWTALLMLAPAFLGHFRIEHNAGHHVDVATPKDHATARFNESFWHFMTREIPGAWTRAWAIEAKRARKKGYAPLSLRNEVVQTVLLQIVIWGAVIAWLGLAVLTFLIGAMIVGVMGLSSQNYIAHYGLLRDQRADGKYLPPRPEHSWNSNSLVTNLITFNLARHSDHHAHPYRHYQYLRSFKDAPQLPYGYGTMFLIAYVPPLFRKVMNPRVLANVDGDMDKVLTREKALAAGARR